MIQSLTAHTPVKDPSLYSVIGMQSVDPNAIMDRTSLDIYQSYFVAEGSVPQQVNLEPYIDQSYLNAALDRLGRES